MVFHPLSHGTLMSIRELAEANFAGRDELYAAVATVDDAPRKNICKQLADHLAAHGTELRQILVSSGHGDFDVADYQFLDHLTERMFLEMVKEVHGESSVLAAIEQCERNLKDRYDRTLESVPEQDAAGLLQRQRNQVEFGEQVAQTMRKAADKDRGSGK